MTHTPVTAPAIREPRRVITWAQAKKWLPAGCKGEMDPKFPLRGATCDEDFIRNVFQGPYAFRRGCNIYVVGQEEMKHWATVAMFSIGERHPGHFGAGHLLLSGPPGGGKTLLEELIRSLYKATTSRLQGGEDQMSSDVTGNMMLDIDANGQRFMAFRKGPIFADIVSADEISRYTKRAQAGFLQTMSEGKVTVDGVTHPNPAMILGTTNEASVVKLIDALDDRFMLMARIQPLQWHEYVEIEKRTRGFLNIKVDFIDSYEAVKAMRLYFHECVTVTDEVGDFMGKIAETVNRIDGSPLLKDLRVRLGLSEQDEFLQNASKPFSGRCFPEWAGGARALAASNYRNYVTRDDIKQVLLPLLRHRMHYTATVLSPPVRLSVQTELRERFDGTGKIEMADYLTLEIIDAAWNYVAAEEVA